MENYLGQELEISLIKRLSQFVKNRFFVDIGAEKGSFSAVLLKAGMQGVMFEPMDRHHPILTDLIQKNNSAKLYPWAIAECDGERDFYIASSADSAELDFFHSLRKVEGDKQFNHSQSIKVQCRSVSSLIEDGIIPKSIGIIKTDTEGNDLFVLQGLGKLKSELVICEYFTEGVYSGWQDGHPTPIINLMKSIGYTKYLVIKRVDELEYCTLNPATFIPNQWGNLFFFSDELYETAEPSIIDFVAQSEQSFISKLKTLATDNIEKEAVIKNLETTCLERLVAINQLDSELNRRNDLNETTHLRALLEDKEALIQQLKNSIDLSQANLSKLQESLIEKESVIQVLSKAVTAYRLLRMFSPTWTIKKIASIVGRHVAPRLGNLNQYEPVPLRTIPHYSNSTEQGNLPTISIVTPSYRQGDFIERTLLSVLNQNYPKLEYYVQDGGSQDNTVAILKSYEGKLAGWSSKKDNGQSQAINLGFANTSGEIMAWLNSDDLLLPGTLAIVADYFHQHPEVDLVYGNRLLIDEKDMEIGRWILPGHDSDVLSWVDYIPQETMFWRRSLWNKVGGTIDESFKFAMDWDLLLRFREAGANVAHIPRFLGAFRIHEQQKTSAVINEIGHQEMNRIRERCLGKVPTRKEIRNKVIPFMFKHVAVDIIYQIKKKLTYK